MNNQELCNQMKEWRHRIHMHPETAFNEKETSEFVADILTELGLEVHKNIGGTGIVANMKVGNGTGVIGLRADMDAIILNEEGEHAYKSINEGVMHGCGHDGHVATLLGAAKILSERKNFNGTVRFIFQPAEEPGKGAVAMLNDGLLEKFPMDEIYAFHNAPFLSYGTICTRQGGILSSEDNFVIDIKGKGGHASSPHLGVDPLVTAAQIILALQTIPSRNVNPLLSAVVSCTELHTDGAHNAIPSNVRIMGDTRSYSPDVQKLIEERMRAICEEICRMNNAECEFQYTHEFAPTYNWKQCVETAVKAAKKVVGEEFVDGNCEPIMPSEDFGNFLREIPGCYVLIGSRESEDPDDFIPPHNSCFDYNDNILETGAEFFAELIKERLPV